MERKAIALMSKCGRALTRPFQLRLQLIVGLSDRSPQSELADQTLHVPLKGMILFGNAGNRKHMIDIKISCIENETLVTKWQWCKTTAMLRNASAVQSTGTAKCEWCHWELSDVTSRAAALTEWLIPTVVATTTAWCKTQPSEKTMGRSTNPLDDIRCWRRSIFSLLLWDEENIRRHWSGACSD